jgi:autotransporter-associated beta strand protein
VNDNSSTLFLSGANTYSGGTEIDGGTLTLLTGGTLGAAGGVLTMHNNGTLNLYGNNASVSCFSTSSTDTGTVITDTSGTPQTLTVGGSSNAWDPFYGTIQGNVALTVGVGNGCTHDLALYNSGNCYTGPTTVNANSGSSSKANLCAYTNSAFSPNSALVDNGNVDLVGHYVTVASLAGSGILTSWASGQSSTLYVNGSATTTFSGTLANGSATLALNQEGSGTLTLSGTSTNTGVTTISSGTLNVTGAIASAVIVGGGTLAGTGSTGAVTDNSGLVSPAGAGAVGTLTVNGLNLTGSGAGYYVDITNSGADMLYVPSGTVTLGTGAVFTGEAANVTQFQPVSVLVDNAGGSAVNGTFYLGGMPLTEGTGLFIHEGLYFITYHFNCATGTLGNGNSVALVVAPATNWAGYTVNSSQQNAVSAVGGSWTVPTVSGSAGSALYSSEWVGIDGSNSSTVEQCGTESDYINGKAQYSAWYEMYPNYSVTITSMTVNAGDAITASVTYITSGPYSGQFQLTVTDTSQPNDAYTTYQSVPPGSTAQRSSAEWIVEAPNVGGQQTTPPNFGTVSFTNCTATINGVTGPIDMAGWASEPSYLVTSGGSLLAEPSGLADAGGSSNFAVVYAGTESPSSTSGSPIASGSVVSLPMVPLQVAVPPAGAVNDQTDASLQSLDALFAEMHSFRP